MSNQVQTTTPAVSPVETIVSNPYSPSFVDRLMDAVKRLPFPYWLTYLLVFVLMAASNHVLSWVDGWLPALSFSSLILVYPLWFAFPLAAMTYLNSVARDALTEFGPLLDLSHDQRRQLENEFTNMPQRSVVFSSVFWAI